jgi:hypothetical protein
VNHPGPWPLRPTPTPPPERIRELQQVLATLEKAKTDLGQPPITWAWVMVSNMNDGLSAAIGALREIINNAPQPHR